MLIENKTQAPLKEVYFRFKKAKSDVVVAVPMVDPQSSVLAFLAAIEGEYSVDAHVDLVVATCAEYWTGWPMGFQLKATDASGLISLVCTNRQWVDRYSAFEFLFGNTRKLERQVRASAATDR